MLMGGVTRRLTAAAATVAATNATRCASSLAAVAVSAPGMRDPHPWFEPVSWRPRSFVAHNFATKVSHPADTGTQLLPGSSVHQLWLARACSPLSEPCEVVPQHRRRRQTTSSALRSRRWGEVGLRQCVVSWAASLSDGGTTGTAARLQLLRAVAGTKAPWSPCCQLAHGLPNRPALLIAAAAQHGCGRWRRERCGQLSHIVWHVHQVRVCGWVVCVGCGKGGGRGQRAEAREGGGQQWHVCSETQLGAQAGAATCTCQLVCQSQRWP